MTEQTDPAYEFAELCQAIRAPSKSTGVVHLAQHFETEPHSHNFYQILLTIVDRAENLKSIISQLDNAAYLAPQLLKNISAIIYLRKQNGFVTGSRA